jgi:hypothetical protein
MGEAFRALFTAPLNPVRPAGALGSRVAEPFVVSQSPRRRLGATSGGARAADKERPRSELPVGLSQPTAQMVLTRVAVAATPSP